MCLIIIHVTGSSDMAKELNQIAKEFSNHDVKVLRTNLNLYLTPISTAAGPFLKQVSAQAKKEKVSTVTIVAIIKESE